VNDIVEKAKLLKTGNGMDLGVDVGPVITKESLQRIHGLIDTAQKEGCKILLDGRTFKHPKYPNGN